jgi:tape measure domain-containing protein
VPGEDRHSIVIEIDPSKASRGSADVVKGLEEVNATLRTIGNLAISELAKITAGMNGIAAATTRARSEVSALSGLAASFGRLGETIKAARDRTDQLNTALTTMRGFEGLTAAIQRQESVLERIHGPMREYEADLAAINHLYQRGALSALEYTSEVNRMNAAIGKTPKPGGGSQIGEGLARGAGVQGLLTGGAAGLAAAGAQAAVSSIGAIGDMSDAYTNLDNRLRKVTADEETRAELLQRTKQIAQESRSEWASTGELFVRLSNSTKDLNLGQERTLRLTETISKAFAMSGASASESAGAMLQLSQAFASGHLQGDEFRSMAEAVPDVMDLIAKQMHVTRGELKQLGSDGKISSDVIVAAFESAQRDIDSGFARTAPTLSQSWTMFKNDMTETVAKLVKDTDLLPTVASAFKDLAGAISTVADAYHAVRSAREAIGFSGTSGTGSEGSVSGKIPGLRMSGAVDPAGLASIPGKVKDIFSGKAFDVSDEEMHKATGVFGALRDAADHTSNSLDGLIAKQIAQAETLRNSIPLQNEANQKISETVAEIRGQMTPALAEQAERWGASIGLATTAADTLASYLERVMKVTDAIKNQWSPVTERQTKNFERLVGAVSAPITGDSWGVVLDKTNDADKGLVAVEEVVEKLHKGFGILAGDIGLVFDTSSMSSTDALVGAFGEMLTSARSLDTMLKGTWATIGDLSKEAQTFNDALDLVKGNASAILGDFSKTAMVLPDLIRKGVEYIALKKGDPWAPDPKKHEAMSLEAKLYEEIMAPLRNYTQGVHAIDDLLKRHMITTQQYTRELEKLTDAWSKADEMAALINSATPRRRAHGPATPQSNDAEVSVKVRDLELDEEENIKKAKSLELERELAAATEKEAVARNKMRKDAEQYFGQIWSRQTNNSEFLRDQMNDGNIRAGIKLSFDEWSKDSDNAALSMNKAFTTAFQDLEQQLFSFVDNGRFELGKLARDLEHLLLDLAFRQAAGGIGSWIGGGGGGALSAFAGAASGGDGSQLPGTDGGLITPMMAHPTQIHLHLGDQATTAMVASSAGQAAITNVVYKQHGATLATRQRLRSRG